MANKEITVKGLNVKYKKVDQSDYISLTDIAKFKNPSDPRFTVYTWLRSKETLRFFAVWEELNNVIITVSNSIRLQRMPAQTHS